MRLAGNITLKALQKFGAVSSHIPRLQTSELSQNCDRDGLSRCSHAFSGFAIALKQHKCSWFQPPGTVRIISETSPSDIQSERITGASSCTQLGCPSVLHSQGYTICALAVGLTILLCNGCRNRDVGRHYVH